MLYDRTGIGVCWYALKEKGSCSIAEWTIDNVSVPSDPAWVSHTGHDISARVVVIHRLRKGSSRNWLKCLCLVHTA